MPTYVDKTFRLFSMAMHDTPGVLETGATCSINWYTLLLFDLGRSGITTHGNCGGTNATYLIEHWHK